MSLCIHSFYCQLCDDYDPYSVSSLILAVQLRIWLPALDAVSSLAHSNIVCVIHGLIRLLVRLLYVFHKSPSEIVHGKVLLEETLLNSLPVR